MNTPPKAPCPSCNGTGIDPTVGFLDCEFCTPAYAGASLSAPEQLEPKCTMYNDHGEIGGLRPDGYDGERCPDCNPATVKRYHVTEAGLVEGHALGRLNVVLGADHDRVTAERDALQQRLTVADERADTATSLIQHIVANFNTEIEYHEDVEPNDLEHDQVLAEMREFLSPKDTEWRMHPCKNGHLDVGAAGGVAHCCTCDEKISAANTQEAFEQWNATHPAS